MPENLIAEYAKNNQSISGEHHGVVLWGTRNVFYVLPREIHDELLHTSGARVSIDGAAVECRLKGKRQYHDDESRSHNVALVAGDFVRYVVTCESGAARTGLITGREDRVNSIVRAKNDTLYPVAVNIDLLGIVLSIDEPPFRPRFADRLLWIALEQKITPLIIINKMDLYHAWSDEIRARAKAFERIGVDAAYVSAVDTGVIQKLRLTSRQKSTQADEYISANNLAVRCAGKRCAFVGQSGAGKSSIVNAIIPAAARDVGDVSSKYNRGRHTTTRAQMIFGEGLCIIDTPGIRDLFPSRVTKHNICVGFPDIAACAETCAHANCTHTREPGCAVVSRVGDDIHPDRYVSYTRLLSDIEAWDKSKWYRRKR